MTTTKKSQLTSSRFINMCVANWFLHIYVYSLLPLLHRQSLATGGSNTLVGWAVLAFAAGMILPGPFGAHLMERRSRKEVFLKSLLLMGLLPTLGYVYATDARWLIVLHGLQGVAFGVAQTALGTTLVNDVLASKQRNRGDVIYAWAGRLGIPLGPVAGLLLVSIFPLGQAYWWTLVFCMMAFLLVGQTQVPLKAPVKVSLLTLDRFFLPHTLIKSLSLFAAPWLMGRLTGSLAGMTPYLFMFAGALAAFLWQLALRKRTEFHKTGRLGYLLLLLPFPLSFFPSITHAAEASFLLVGMGAGIVSSSHLRSWVTSAEHCQRGTAQNTYMISWRSAFSIGFLMSVYTGTCYDFYDLLLVIICGLTYVLWGKSGGAKSE